MSQADPCKGKWYVNGEEVDIWVDASSLATGVLLESHGTMIEDACWMQPASDTRHINLAELDAIIKGVNLATHWETKFLHLMTDSLCVHRWLTNTLTGKSRVNTKAASEMLIRRRLQTFS